MSFSALSDSSESPERWDLELDGLEEDCGVMLPVLLKDVDDLGDVLRDEKVGVVLSTPADIEVHVFSKVLDTADTSGFGEGIDEYNKDDDATDCNE